MYRRGKCIKSSLAPPPKRISTSFDTLDILVTQGQVRASKATNARPIDAAPLPLLLLLATDLPLEDDAILLCLAPALGLPSLGGGDHALPLTHGHLLLLEDGRLGAEGLDAEVGGLLARAAVVKGLDLRGGGEERRGPRRGQEVGFGNEAAKLEVLRQEGGGVLWVRGRGG